VDTRGHSKEPRLSWVVPVYNEEDGLGELLRRLKLASVEIVGEDYEIVCVNDGSTDGSLDFLKSQEQPALVVVDLARNYGHQIALTAGLEAARGARVLIIDADLQDPPELVGPMMALMDDGNDVVYGVRKKRDGENWFKLGTAYAFYRLVSKLSSTPIAPDAGDFRLMSRRAVDNLNSMPERFRFVRGMVGWLGLKQVPIHYDRAERFAGKTHYPLRKMLVLAIDAITSFSILPLRFASLAGAICGLLGILLMGFALYAWITGNVVQGWTSLAGLVLLLGSVQLLILGVFGEYLGRMYLEVKRRPLYFVNELITNGARETNSSPSFRKNRRERS